MALNLAREMGLLAFSASGLCAQRAGNGSGGTRPVSRS